MISIESIEQKAATTKQLRLPEGCSLVRMCSQIINEAYDKGKERVAVKIKRSLFPRSYRQVPPMFATSGLREATEYTNVRSYRRGEFIFVVASDRDIPTTFTGLVRYNLAKNRKFTRARRDIPVTYRYRATDFAKSLSKQLGERVKVTKTKTHIIFKIK